MNKKTKIFTIVALCLCVILSLAACNDKKPQQTEFTINFLNYDGNVLKILTVKRGEKPSYDETPTKQSDAEYSYTFVGWKDKNGQVYTELPQIYANAAFTAEFSSQKRTYKITFCLPGQNVEITVTAGETPVYDGPTKIDYDGKIYNVVGWDKPLQAAYAEATYTAVLKADEEEVTTSKVTFFVENEQISFVYPVGTVPVFFGTPYKKAAQHSEFVFVGWKCQDGTEYLSGTKLPVTTNEDVTYTAIFEEKVNTYKVKLYDYDGTSICVISTEYGTVPTYDGKPQRQSTEKYDYEFVGWTDGVKTYNSLPKITSDTELRAEYKSTLRKYTLKISYSDGIADYVDKLAYGDSYRVASPTVDGKYADKQYVSGVITQDTDIAVTYGNAVVWNGSASSSLTTNDGTDVSAGSKINPYLITSGADLAYLANQSFQKNYGANTYYKLTVDIDLANISWKPICAAKGTTWNYFQGDFDGNNHKIFNLNVDTTYKSAGLGLFGGVSGSVENLTVTGKMTAKNRLGAICYVLKGGTLSNVNAYVDITATAADNGAYIGGLVGMASGGFEITNSNSFGNVICLTQDNNGNRAGGIVGFVQTGTAAKENKIVCCNSYGKVSSYRWAGGIVGHVAALNLKLTLQNCSNYGTVATTANAAGGVVGYAETSSTAKVGSVANCLNYGVVSGKNYVGGICGWTQLLETENCTNFGYVKGGTYVGGICGAATSKNVSDCTNNGNVYGTGSSTGGICGTFELTTSKSEISDCVNHGTITNANSATTAAAGGICGSVKSVTIDGKLVSPIVQGCTNDGDVHGLHNFVGGIVGSNNGGKITTSSNKGFVRSVGGVYVGGVAGSNYGYGYVGNCVNTGLVAGSASVGQICGQLTDTSTAESNSERGSAVENI